MGLDGISKLQVPEIAKKLDGTVGEFRDRVLDGGPFPFVWVQGDAPRRISSIGPDVVPILRRAPLEWK